MGSPTLLAWKVVPPAAIRFTTMRLAPFVPESLGPLKKDRPPYQMLPALSAANIGSQHMSDPSSVALPGRSIVAGMVRAVHVCPPSPEIHASNGNGGSL